MESQGKFKSPENISGASEYKKQIEGTCFKTFGKTTEKNIKPLHAAFPWLEGFKGCLKNLTSSNVNFSPKMF